MTPHCFLTIRSCSSSVLCRQKKRKLSVLSKFWIKYNTPLLNCKRNFLFIVIARSRFIWLSLDLLIEKYFKNLWFNQQTFYHVVFSRQNLLRNNPYSSSLQVETGYNTTCIDMRSKRFLHLQDTDTINLTQINTFFDYETLITASIIAKSFQMIVYPFYVIPTS